MELDNVNHVSTTAAQDIRDDPQTTCFQQLAAALVQLTGCEQQVAHGSILWANDMSHLVVKVPRLRIRDTKPEDLADDLQQRWPELTLFGHPVSDGINLLLYFNSVNLGRLLLPHILDQGSSYGKHSGTGGGADDSNPDRKSVVVEFSSPNVGKAFDGMHLRSTILGAFIASTYENMGWQVYRLNFLGDWGKHIGLIMAGWSKFGSDEALTTDPPKHLLEVHTKTNDLLKEQQEAGPANHPAGEDAQLPSTTEVEAERDQFCKQLEDGEPDALELWKKFRHLCVEQYVNLYARLGVAFDEYSGESQVPKECIEEAENTLKEKGVYHETHEGWFIEFSKPGQKGLGSVKARSRDGTTTYLLRDVAAVLERNKKHSFDKMVYVVSGRQTAHFSQVIKAVELMGLQDVAQKLEHFSFGDVHGVSAAEGANGLLLNDILDQCRAATKLALDTDQDTLGQFFGLDPQKIDDSLGSLNLMTDVLYNRRVGTLEVDVNKMAAGGDYTGTALQKWYSVLASRLGGVEIDRAELETIDYTIFETEDGLYADIMRLLVQYPGIVRTWAFDKFDSSHVLTFLFTIVDILPSIWDEGSEAEGSSQSLAKVALYQCIRQTLENGMRLLGLTPIKG